MMLLASCPLKSFHIGHTLAVQEDEPMVEPIFSESLHFPFLQRLTTPQLQLSQLILGWGNSLESLDLSGCCFRSSTFVDHARCMVAMKRLILRHAKGEPLVQVVRGHGIGGFLTFHGIVM